MRMLVACPRLLQTQLGNLTGSRGYLDSLSTGSMRPWTRWLQVEAVVCGTDMDHGHEAPLLPGVWPDSALGRLEMLLALRALKLAVLRLSLRLPLAP